MDLAARQPAAISQATLAKGGVAATVFAWGIGGPLVKLTSLNGIGFSFYRLWMGVILMLAFVRLARRPFGPALFARALPGGLLFGINVLLFFTAIKVTSVANANLISALQPALVLLVAERWFEERVGRREVLWTAVAIAGVAIVIFSSSGDSAGDLRGDALAVGAVITFTAYFLVSKRVAADQIGALEYTAAVQLIAAIVVSSVALASTSIEVPSGEDLLWISIVSLVGGAGGHMVMNWAHRYVDITASSLMMLGAPVVAAPAAWLILDERLVPLQVAGGIVTLAAIAVVIARPRAPALDEALPPVAAAPP